MFIFILFFNFFLQDNKISRRDNNNDEINLDNINLKISDLSGKIRINGNQGWLDFKNAGNCTGQGIYSDPYIIKDLKIDGDGLRSCILIENSDVYFKIENCIVKNTGIYDAGIYLYNVDNGLLLNNNCSHTYYGICLEICENNTISNNTVSYNEWHGILLYTENYNNTVSGNTVYKNMGDGINLDYPSNNNTISGNNITDNSRLGIFIFDSYNNKILENIVKYNYIGIVLHCAFNNTVRRNTAINNYHSGIWIYYMSVNNKISDNTINNNLDNGIYLSLSKNNTISGNVVINNTNGITLQDDCDNNTFFGNIINNNNFCGVNITTLDCSENLFYNNNLSGNLLHQASDDGSNNNWNNTVIGNYWSDYIGNDLNNDGIGDTPYNIFGSAGSKGYFPIFIKATAGGLGGLISGYELLILISIIFIIPIIIIIKRFKR